MSAYPPPIQPLLPFNPANFNELENNLTLAEANSLYLQLSGGTLTGLTSFNAGLASKAGLVNAPSFYMSTDTTTGLYRPAANQVGITCSGSQVGNWTSTGLAVTGAASTTTTMKIGSNGSTITNLTGGISVIAPALAPGTATSPTVVSFGFTFSSAPKVIATFNTKGGGNSQGLLLTVTNITTTQFTYTIYNALGSTSASLNQDVNWLAWL